MQTIPSPDSPAKLPPGLGVSAPYPPPVERMLEHLGNGIRSYLAKDYAAAVQDLSAAGEAATLGDYAAFYRGKASLMLDRDEDALRAFRAVQSGHPDSPVFEECVLGEAEALLELGNPRGALETLKSARAVPESQVLYLRARALEQSGDTEQAISTYRRIYAGFVNAESADLAAQRLRAISPRFLAGTSGYRLTIERAENLMAVGRNREARTLLTRLARTGAPDPAIAARRLILLGETDYALGKGAQVLTYLKSAGTAAGPLQARLAYLRGALYRRTDDEASFLAMRDEALRLHPASPWTEKLLLSVATYYDVNGDLARGQDAYRTLREKFPSGQYAEQALWKVAFYSYAQRRYEDALRSFWEYLTAYPDGGPAGAPVYWMARCYENIGDTATAAFLYDRVEKISNWSYYGGLAVTARQVLEASGTGTGRPFSGIDLGQVIRAVDRIRPVRSSVTAPGTEAVRVLERAFRLAAAGLQDLAISELKNGIERLPAEKSLSYVLARQHEAKGDYYGVIVALRRAFPDYADRPRSSLPPEVWDLLFPVLHWEVIAGQAAKNDLDPNLVLGLIRQESAFHEGARSQANARGLMQILPSTGRMLARDAGVNRYTVGKLFRPDANIALGTRYLASLLRQFDGKVELALAAYNAGKNRAERWHDQFGSVDRAEFVERIPFSETRGYIKQVLTNKAHYAFLTPSLRGQVGQVGPGFSPDAF